jgi:hypothetical protein
MSRFNLGEEVEWTSKNTTKRGRVAAVIPPHSTELLICLTVLSRLPRNHESYLIHIPSKSGKGDGRMYWPRVSTLRRLPVEPRTRRET